MNVLFLKFFFSVDQIGSQRIKFQHKICFRDDIKHLRLKSTPCISIASRLSRDGKILKIFRNCKKFYYNFILKKLYNLPPNNEFKNFYFQHQSFKDFDRVLFWKISSINPLFNLKKIKNRKLLYYLKPNRRISLILKWLKYFVKLSKKNYNNNVELLFKPLFIFISTQKEKNALYSIKLKLYKMRLVRG